ncbi:MAG: HD domain-containing protein [Methanotrichaceae archaeon]|nr:HD domain-containing protein [Methanotrichaceae archaeon]
MTEIRDPIHGYIKLNPLAQSLADTPPVQRLRWIKQLGLANLVYPGANHSRFEHSLGVYHLAYTLSEHLDLDPEERLRVEAAALLHDIGHGPLSHVTESALSPFLRTEHESIIDWLKRGELRDVLQDYGLNPHEIQSLIKGSKLGQIVNSEIDADRMDYLMRDAHYTGVAYGVIDHLRLIEKMTLHQGRLAVEAGGIQAATSLLISRLLMHPSVYYHHVSRIAESMISSGIRAMIENGAEASEIKCMDDFQLFSAMSSGGGLAEEMISRIKSRRLFKRAVYVGLDSLDSPLSRSSESRMAQEVADIAGLPAEYVLVDYPSLPDSAEGDFPSIVGEKTMSLREVSPLVAILERAERASWRFGVYCRKEDRDRVAQAARRCFNLKRSTVQNTLADME